jgi:hypothetical protein
LAGLGIGSFVGLSTGVAAGGDAVNGVFVFGPIGAFIGWPLARHRHLEQIPVEIVADSDDPKIQLAAHEGPPFARKVLLAVFVFFASLWNAHIYLLQTCSVLPIFMQKPWLFFVLGIVISIPFPPFLGVYLFAYLGASHFGMSEKTSYRANITDLEDNF